MNIKRAILCVPAMLMLVAGCGKSEKGVAGDSAVVDSAIESGAVSEVTQNIEAEAEDPQVEQAQMAMLQALLADDYGEDADKLRKYCTANALQQLRDDYEYDDVDGTALAVWAINGRQCPDVKMELMSLKKVAPDTYQATFKNILGDGKEETSQMEYRLAEDQGQWKIDSYRQISYN